MPDKSKNLDVDVLWFDNNLTWTFEPYTSMSTSFVVSLGTVEMLLECMGAFNAVKRVGLTNSTVREDGVYVGSITAYAIQTISGSQKIYITDEQVTFIQNENEEKVEYYVSPSHLEQVLSATARMMDDDSFPSSKHTRVKVSYLAHKL